MEMDYFVEFNDEFKLHRNVATRLGIVNAAVN